MTDRSAPSEKVSATDEIEISPAMIRAGTDVAWGGPFEFPTDKNIEEMVRKIFEAMSKAK